MRKSTENHLFNALTRQFKRFAGAFKEKPQAKLDDYILDHFMQYHALVGTTDENLVKFRNVRRDFLDAFQNKSPAETAIALKLDPFQWTEKLQQIFDQAQETFARPVLTHCLLPPETDAIDKAPNHVPLKHPDWRVRANAAKILVYLNVEEAIPQIINALHDASQTEDQRPGFMHIAYALAKTNSPEAKAALASNLSNDEPWFRVDAAGALASWPLQEVQHELLNAMTRPHLLNDYMAVAITRNHSPAKLLANAEPEHRQGAIEIVISLIEAANGPFANDVGKDSALFEVMEQVAGAAQSEIRPRNVRAAFMLSDWISSNADAMRFGADEQMIERAVKLAQESSKRLIEPTYTEKLVDWLKNNVENDNPVELKHALYLAGRYKLADAAPYIESMIKPEHPAIDEVLEAAGALGLVKSVPAIIEVMKANVDIADRTTQPLSKQPVFEVSVSGAKTYWQALKALGNLPCDEAFQALFTATNDFAPDKRQQALLSLTQNAKALKQAKYQDTAANAVARMLADPSPAVQTAALSGVSELELEALMPEVIKLAGSKETAVSRGALNAMKSLANSGHGKKVKAVVESELSAERDAYRRQRLQHLLQSIR